MFGGRFMRKLHFGALETFLGLASVAPATAATTVYIGTQGQAAFNAATVNRVTDTLDGATPGTGIYSGAGFSITNGTDPSHGDQVTIVDPGDAYWSDDLAQRYSGKLAQTSSYAIGVSFDTAVHAFSADLGALLQGRTFGSDGKFGIGGAAGVDHRIIDTYAAFGGPGPECDAFTAVGQCGGLTFFGVISDEAFDFVEIVSDTYGDEGNFALIDNITIAEAAPVPDAAEWSTMAAGLALVGGIARRRSARRA